MELTSIGRFTGGRNMGGEQKKFSFIPVTDVTDIPFYEGDNLEEAIVLAAGKEWLTAVAVTDTVQLTEKPVGEAGNPIGYEVTLEGEFAKSRLTLLHTMHRMEGKRFFVLAKDNNGYTRLLGNTEKDRNGVYKGLKFTAPFDSGKTVASRNSHAFRFAGQQAVRAPFYFLDDVDTESDYVESDYWDEDYCE